MSHINFTCYECDEDCTESGNSSSFCETAINCWKSSLREKDGSIRYGRGCITKMEQVRHFCSPTLQANNSEYRTECCITEFCNGGVFPILDDTDSDHPLSFKVILISALITLVAVGFLFFGICYCLKSRFPPPRRTWRMRRAWDNVIFTANPASAEIQNTAAADSTAKEHLGSPSVPRRSGSAKPVPTKRILSREIDLVETLSEGCFGTQQPSLRRGIWRGENVMIKIYSSRSEEIWAHETDVYTRLLRTKHNNILEYLGSDRTSVAGDAQLWLVTHYHQTNGSLVNYLKKARLNRRGILKTCLSLADGLFYLHTEKSGRKAKLAMAHRNLSSKNIFVRRNGVCVIGGLECLATQERLDVAYFLTLASKRYMSPELLEPTFEDEIWSLEGFQQADIYSMSLIFWEICRMCVQSADDVSNYVAAFSEWLTNDEQEPTLEAMRKVVLVDRRRPEILDQWRTDPVMGALGSMMVNCWNTKTSARWSILQVKETLSKLK